MSVCVFISTGPLPICSIDKAMDCMYIAESKNDHASEIIFKSKISLDGSILLPFTHIYVNELDHHGFTCDFGGSMPKQLVY